MEAVVLVGGLSLGLAKPLIGLFFHCYFGWDAAVRRISFAPFHPKWFSTCPIRSQTTRLCRAGDHPDSIDL